MRHPDSILETHTTWLLAPEKNGGGLELTPNAPDNPDYIQLLLRISSTFCQGQARAAQAVNTTLIDTYWHVGQHIVEFEQAGQQRATYGCFFCITQFVRRHRTN